MIQGRLLTLLTAAAIVAVTFVALDARSTKGEASVEHLATATRTMTVLSDVYSIERKYRSMMGPSSGQDVRLLDVEPAELLWITGYEAEMVGPDGETPRAPEFMCHSNLDIDVEAHEELLGDNHAFSTRLFTLSQGQLSARFPAGFGIPIMSSETLDLTTQVLNLNLEEEQLRSAGDLEVRHKVSIEFVRDRDVKGGRMKPLFPIAGYGLTLLEGDSGYFGVSRPDEEAHGPGCLVGDSASDAEYEDGMGRKFTGHWVVPPGREVNRTLVTRLMRVPYDTRIHYIAVHLHPFAESLELRDLTVGETLFKSEAENFGDRIGLAHVDYLESAEGIEVFADHEYEMISVYNNTTDEDQDSMAVMYMYLWDRELDRKLARGIFPKSG